MNSASQKPPKRQRLFFALWPSHAIRKQMAALNRELPLDDKGGRLMNDSNLHLTLHYIGPVVADKVKCLKFAASRVKSSPFKLTLDRLGYFKRPKVLWLGCEEMTAGYTALLEQLAEKIADCGFAMEAEANRLHVTLRRKASRPKEYADIKSIEWDVEQFVLVESVSIEGGVSYRVIAQYPLN